MKKQILLILFALLLTACSKTVAPYSTPAKPINVSSANEIIALSRFNGTGLYEYAIHDSGSIKPYLSFVDCQTATQVPLCNTPSCQHDTLDCTAVFSSIGTLFSYNDKLIFCSDGLSSGYDSTINFGTQTEASSVIVADKTGGNRKTLADIDGEFLLDADYGVYKENLIFMTAATGGTMVNSMSLNTGEVKQLFEQPALAATYLGFYKNNVVFTDFAYTTDIISIKVCLLNADDSSIKILKEFEIPSKKSQDYYQSPSFHYYNGKIYHYTTDIAKKADTIIVIDCETGEEAVLCDDIKNESPWEQSIYAIINDVIIIDSPQSGDDKNMPLFRRLTYNITTGEKGEISLIYKEPSQGEIYPVNIIAQMGDNLYVEQSKASVIKIMNNFEGIPTETEMPEVVYAIISKEDYLSGTPNFKTITK